MKKHEIFTFAAPNGVEVTAVVVAIISSSKYQTVFLCYAQNRLFTYYEHIMYELDTQEEADRDYSYGEILVEYCILPDFDSILDRYNDIEIAQTETQSGM